MKTGSRILLSLLVLMALFVSFTPRAVYSQAQSLLFGSYNNAAKAVTVTSNGYLNVSVQGGGAGVIAPANGGTGISSYAVGDMLYASGATTLSKLAAVASGSVLCSAGVTTAPTWCASPSVTGLTFSTSLAGGAGVPTTAIPIFKSFTRDGQIQEQLVNPSTGTSAYAEYLIKSGTTSTYFGSTTAANSDTVGQNRGYLIYGTSNTTTQPGFDFFACTGACGGAASFRWLIEGYNATTAVKMTLNATALSLGTSVFMNTPAGYKLSTVLWESGTAPTIASGGCTSPAVTSSNGTAAFLLTIGSSCTGVKTVVLTMPAAAHFWAVHCDNNTSDAQQQSNYIASRATSTTAVTLTNYARTTGLQSDFTAADTLLCQAAAE